MVEADHEGNVAVVEEGRLMGPSAAKFLRVCWSMQPGKLAILWASAGIFFLATLVVTLGHRWALLREPIGIRRQYYIRIVLMPVVMSSMGLLSLVSPGTVSVAIMIQKFYEAVALSTFGMLLFLLLWHESQTQAASPTEQEGTAEAPTGIERVAQALAQGGPRKHWGAPPLGCCWRPCLPKHNLTVRQLSIVFSLVRQYVVLTPVLGAVDVILYTALKVRTVRGINRIFKYVVMVSNLLCLYGLFVAYQSTHDLLHQWNTTRKFVAIKVVLVISIYQEFLMEKFFSALLESNNRSCFKEAGFIFDWVDVEVRYWCMWLLSLEMLGMAFALRRAFPPEELRQRVLEIHHVLLDMEMSRHMVRESKEGESESEEQDEDGESDEADPDEE